MFFFALFAPWDIDKFVTVTAGVKSLITFSSPDSHNELFVIHKIASSSTFRPHPERVLRDLFRLLNAVYSIVQKH